MRGNGESPNARAMVKEFRAAWFKKTDSRAAGREVLTDSGERLGRDGEGAGLLQP